ncbi:MAG: hypothetical protein QOE36_2103 [Gaiellaceae bacterium]|nr:hypothetical protein [Gaiellaceae bacterium]
MSAFVGVNVIRPRKIPCFTFTSEHPGRLEVDQRGGGIAARMFAPSPATSQVRMRRYRAVDVCAWLTEPTGTGTHDAGTATPSPSGWPSHHGEGKTTRAPCSIATRAAHHENVLREITSNRQ